MASAFEFGCGQPPHAVYLSLGDDAMARQQAYRDLMRELVDLDVIAKIRHCANTGLVLGTEKFRKQVAVMVEYHLTGTG